VSVFQTRRIVPVAFLVLLFVVGGSIGRRSSGTHDVAAQAITPGWNEVLRSHSGSYGWVSGYGKWAFVSDTVFDSWAGPGYRLYAPITGGHAYWWTEGYDDSGWSNNAYSDWDPGLPGWGFPAHSLLGPYILSANASLDNGINSLHRRTFTVPTGWRVDFARFHWFSDNVSTWYINGVQVMTAHGGDITTWIGTAPIHSGANVLAIHLGNDHVCDGCNPNGIAYILELYYTQYPTWSGTVTHDSTGLGIGGVDIQFSGEYELCSAPGTFATQDLGTVATAVDGSYSLALDSLPVCDPATDCCGWQSVILDEVLPWDTFYQPLASSAPPPGTSVSPSRIVYPWQTNGDFPSNDFTVELIPINVTLSVDHPYLVLEGPDLPSPDGPLPSQVIRGTYTGPNPLIGRPVDMHVWNGTSWTTYSTFTDASGNYMIDAGWMGDPLFGTTALGPWQSYAEVTVTGRGIYVTNDAFWRVNWFPVHQTE
jgi:hypothetical protein